MDRRRSGATPGSMSSCSSRSWKPSRGMIRPRPMPSAPSSSWTHIAITAFSKRGSPMPGMASRNWPLRKRRLYPCRRYRRRDRGAPSPRHWRAPEQLARAPANRHSAEGAKHMTIQVGDRIPSMTLVKATRGRPAAGRDATIISPAARSRSSRCPGAFTPTCSARHLPGFVEQGRRAQGEGRRRDRLRRGQRRLRAGRLGASRPAPTAR